MKRRIRRKLNNKSGFTLVEMLCCCLIIILLSLVINTELEMVGTLFGSMIAENEAEILLSSASTVLSDELRYAVNDKGGVILNPIAGATPTESELPFLFESDTYWNNGETTAMYINSQGHLVAKKALPDDSGNFINAEGKFIGTLDVKGDEYPVLPASDYGKSSISGTTYKINSINISKNGNMFTYTIEVMRGTGKYATLNGRLVDEKNPTATGKVKNMPHKP